MKKYCIFWVVFLVLFIIGFLKSLFHMDAGHVIAQILFLGEHGNCCFKSKGEGLWGSMGDPYVQKWTSCRCCDDDDDDKRGWNQIDCLLYLYYISGDRRKLCYFDVLLLIYRVRYPNVKTGSLLLISDLRLSVRLSCIS